MKRLITLDISPATATHCGNGYGQCEHLDVGYQRCDAFPRGEMKFDTDVCSWKRLPECIAAEQNAAQKGGSQ